MMYRYTTAKVALLAAVLLAFEVTLFETLSFRGARAEPLLTLACFTALYARDSRQGMLASWIVGLLKDLGSAGPFGLYALLCLAACIVILRIKQVFWRGHAITQLFVAFVAAFGVNAAAALFVSVTAGSIPLATVLAKTLLSAAFTAAVTPLLLFLITQAKWLVR